MIRTSRRLADGREILYFDREPVPARRDDTRDLPPVATRSQLRYDALLGEWVVIASHRQTRTFLPPADECPLCPSRPGRPTEIPDSDYQVVVFENRFPSLATGVDRDVPPHAPGHPLAELRPGFGRCEVVCFTDDHDRVFAELGHDRARLVVDVWADRTEELSRSRRDRIGLPLREPRRGDRGDPSHPHGQIYAYPYLTPRVEKMLGVRPPAPRGHRWRPVRRGGRRRAVRPPGGHRQRALDGVRPGRHALALRGAVLPDPAGPRHAVAHRRRAGRLRRGLPRRPGPVRPPLGHADALHRVLEPGAGAEPGARTGGCTCSCSRSAARRAS